MSNARINIADQLASITAPNLDASNYAQQLNQTFTNIDNNFTKLANHDFIKGERGDSVKIQEVELISSTTDNNVENEYNIEGLTVFGELLLNSIKNNFITNGTNSNILDIDIDENTKLTWLDNFKSNPGKLYMIYDATASNVDEDKVYSSLYYTFLDGRYANNTIGKLDPSNYQDVSDMSCIAVYDKNLNGNTGGFKIISNAFPTIYYEDGIGLCWKVNGNNTGIPVRGIKGEAGVSSAIYIVSAELTVNSGLAEGPVTGIFEPFTGYKNVDNIDISSYNNCTALVMTNNLNKDARAGGNGNEFYFGTLKTKTENDELKLFASCSPTTSITQSIGVESVINSMKNIDIFATEDTVDSIPRGLFIPISDEIETELEDGSIKREQPVHLISATPISDEEGTINDDKTDIIFTPVNDYNSVKLRSETNEETAKKLKVDKYLYVQINKNHNTVKYNYITQNLWGENASGVSAGAGANFFIESFGDITDHTDNKLKYDGVLKYKLDCVVDLSQEYNSIFDGKYTCAKNGIYNDEDDNPASRSFGMDFMSASDNTFFSEDNNPIKYTNGETTYDEFNDIELLTYDDDHRFSIPESFAGKKIFRWVLCNTRDSWDIEELKKYSNENVYTFPDSLRCIYTTDLSPTSKTEFLWFNGYDYFYGTESIKWITKSDNIIGNIFHGSRGFSKIKEVLTSTSVSSAAKLIAENNLNSLYVNLNPELSYNEMQETDFRPIISGWSIMDANNEPLLNFKKFVPVYDNSFCLEDETSLNLNYNVNITGDSNNYNKSLNVHGNINCDNINVYNLTASGEIKNIYTNDTILGTKGIKLGHKINDIYNYNVDADGNLQLNGNIDMSSSSSKLTTYNFINKGNTELEGFVKCNTDITVGDGGIICNGLIKCLKLDKLYNKPTNISDEYNYAIQSSCSNHYISPYYYKWLNLDLNNVNYININNASSSCNRSISQGILKLKNFNTLGINSLNIISNVLENGTGKCVRKILDNSYNIGGFRNTDANSVFAKLSKEIKDGTNTETISDTKISEPFNFTKATADEEGNTLTYNISVQDGINMLKLSNGDNNIKTIIATSEISNFAGAEKSTYTGINNVKINCSDCSATFLCFIRLTSKRIKPLIGKENWAELDLKTLSLTISVRLGKDYDTSIKCYTKTFKLNRNSDTLRWYGYSDTGEILNNVYNKTERYLPLLFHLNDQDNIILTSEDVKGLFENADDKIYAYITLDSFNIDVSMEKENGTLGADKKGIFDITLYKPVFYNYILINDDWNNVLSNSEIKNARYGYLTIADNLSTGNINYNDLKDGNPFNNDLQLKISYNYTSDVVSDGNDTNNYPELSTICYNGIITASEGYVYGLTNQNHTTNFTKGPSIALYDKNDIGGEIKYINLSELYSLLSSQTATSLLEYGI